MASRRLFIFNKRILKSHPHPLLIDSTGRTCARIGYHPGVARAAYFANACYSGLILTIR